MASLRIGIALHVCQYLLYLHALFIRGTGVSLLVQVKGFFPFPVFGALESFRPRGRIARDLFTFCDASTVFYQYAIAVAGIARAQAIQLPNKLPGFPTAPIGKFLVQAGGEISQQAIGSVEPVSYTHLDVYKRQAYDRGLRAVGPAHYGPGIYAHGTDADQPLNSLGIALLREMEKLSMILDATHLCDRAFWDAVPTYDLSLIHI